MIQNTKQCMYIQLLLMSWYKARSGIPSAESIGKNSSIFGVLHPDVCRSLTLSGFDVCLYFFFKKQ